MTDPYLKKFYSLLTSVVPSLIVMATSCRFHDAYLNTSSIRNFPEELRTRRVDPLQNLLSIIQSGDIKKLKNLLRSRGVLALFEARLLEKRVPKDHSPLVITILNGKFRMFSFILKNFTCNVEQETSAVIEGGYPVEGACPLWTASTLGKLEFVKLLVANGANIEHTTDSRSSPLRGAAFDGHCDVVEFLIRMGANIDKPNQVGQSPLTIAAAMQKKECVELLIKKGADVNHKGHNGDTPLHVCVESGAVEIARLLVDSGAKNNPNDVGFTPAILACCYGHKEVMRFLDSMFKIEMKELYDCYCLLAAKEVLGNNRIQAEVYMRKSLEIRLTDVKLFKTLPPANSIYDNLQEPTDMRELRYILSNETSMFFISSIYCERILGRVHPTTAFYIRISGDMVLVNKRYKKCIDLWHRSLEFDNAARMAYELQITEDLLFAVRGFSIMCEDGFIPPVSPHFQWGLKELRMAHESKIPEVAVVSCLFRMVAVWIMVAEHIEDTRQATEEKSKILDAVDQLISLMDASGCGILIACLQNLPEYTSGAGKDIIKIDIPLHQAVALFLDRGVYIHCEDEHGNFPLHLAVRLMDLNAPKCVKTLLDYGAHHDVVNFNKETALDIARYQTFPPHMPPGGIVDDLTRAATCQLSLQCLAARAVARYGLQYMDVLPHRVFKFVAWHQGDNGAITNGLDDWVVIDSEVESASVISSLSNRGDGGGGLLPQAEAAAANMYVLTHSNGLNTNAKQDKL